MGYIYKITNVVNGKVYIGQTRRTIRVRFSDHITKAVDKGSCSYNTHLGRAIRKYGTDAFTVEEVEQCGDEALNDRETFWIQHYDSVRNGYNMTYGGEGSVIHDYREMLDEWNKGSTISEIVEMFKSTYRCVSSALQAQGVTSEEIKRRGYRATTAKNSYPVYQYDLNGIFVAEYPSLKCAMECCNKSVSYAIDHPDRTACGYLWSRKRSDCIEPFHKACKQNKQTHQYTIDGKYIKSYESAKEASEINGISKSHLCSVCKGRLRSTGGYRWSYIKVDQLPPMPKKVHKKRRKQAI